MVPAARGQLNARETANSLKVPATSPRTLPPCTTKQIQINKRILLTKKTEQIEKQIMWRW
jgi:hypothetical protein